MQTIGANTTTGSATGSVVSAAAIDPEWSVNELLGRYALGKAIEGSTV